MTAIDAITLEKEPYFHFLAKSLNSKNITVFPLAGDASNRRYYRVVHNEQSTVLMRWEPFVDNDEYPFLSVLNHFHKHGVNVPRVIAKSPGEGLVLLEDLGDLTLERKFWENQNQTLAIPFYKQAIDEIIKIHYPSSFDRTNCTAFKIEFNTERLLWEMNYGKEHLLEKMNQISLTEIERKSLHDIFFDVCSRLDKEKKYISHRDYHSRNLMIKLGKMRVIDFQDARLGPIQYDLVSLLKDSYVAMEDNVAHELIQYYLERRKEFIHTPVSMDEFMHVYEIQSIQRCFKACGSFASFYNTRNDTRYIKYLRGTLQRVKSSLEKFPQYTPFKDLLDSYGLFEKDFEVL